MKNTDALICQLNDIVKKKTWTASIPSDEVS